MSGLRAQARVSVLRKHILAGEEIGQSTIVREGTAGSSSLTVTDNRTGKVYDVDITDGTVPATCFKDVRIYDPGFKNTAVARSKICYIDGDSGELLYRGYPIEELAEHSTFLEVAYLLINGDLPSKIQLTEWNRQIMSHTLAHENLKALMKDFRFDAHPMGQFISTVTALGTFYPESNPSLAGEDVFNNKRMRNKSIYRILGKVPTIAAAAYRHRIGRQYNNPSTNPDMSYEANFLYMMDRLGDDPDYTPHPVLVRALRIIFILHAEHELNCSTAAMRHLSSSKVDPFTAIGGAAGALYGPLHGGANAAVLRMLEGIGSVENIPAFIQDVKDRKVKLMGFGHRVYKNYDPRARLMRTTSQQVFQLLGTEPLLEVALELERIALSDEYFKKRRLYPNVDFYSGLIFRAMGFPTDMFPVLFAIPRTAGWLSHWAEALEDDKQAIWRPRQVYTGHSKRAYVPLHKRPYSAASEMDSYHTPFNKRRNASLQ